jgi:hypothetical protein
MLVTGEEGDSHPDWSKFSSLRCYVTFWLYSPLVMASCAGIVWLMNIIMPVPEIYQTDLCTHVEHAPMENSLLDPEHHYDPPDVLRYSQTTLDIGVSDGPLPHASEYSAHEPRRNTRGATGGCDIMGDNISMGDI